VSLAFRRTCLLVALVLLVALAPLARPALAANTYTVTSLADSAAAAAGTLRWAINQANASAGADIINFNIAAAQPWTITVASELPALTDPAGVTIDGSVGGVPKIEIRGNSGTSSVVGQGILVASSNNVIRGLIINGFMEASHREYRGAGIVVSGVVNDVQLASAPSNNTIELCYLGTDYTGNAAGPGGTANNFNAGIILEYGASSTTIQNNVISGNNQWGIYLVSDTSSALSQQNNSIANNKIGLNAAGNAALANGSHGVFISDNSNNNTVGPGNIISGNGAKKNSSLYGVYVLGARTGGGYISGNQVKGNKIGTDATGTTAIPNTGQLNVGSGGVGIGQSQGTLIGGPAAADGNQISGNQEYGVIAKDTSFAATPGITGAVIENNKIGVAADGVTKLANSQGGVLLWSKASGVTVGPTNLIAGNAFFGVRILGVAGVTDPAQQTRNNTITGNFIGTDAGGTTAISNGNYGIRIQGGSAGNTISDNIIRNHALVGVSLEPDTGATPLSPTGNMFTNNQISNNATTGMQLLGTSTGNIIGPGNVIANHTTSGLAIATSQNTVKGNTISGNQIGINITNAATGNTIGGPNKADGNNLINNTLNGVLVTGAGTIDNTITHTTTNNNGDKGIALSNGGNAPIAGASLSGLALSGNVLSGSIANPAACGGSCTIEVFTDNSPLADEGPNFVTSFTSAGSFSGISLPNCQQYLIFTITSSSGSTSEFTNPIGPFAQCVPAAPSVTLSDATPAASQGALPTASAIFHHTVTNIGNAAGVLTITKSSSNGWTTTLDTSACPAGPATLAAGASCDITLTVSVPAGTPPGDQNTTTITAAIAGAAATAQKTDTTTALSAPALTFVPEPPGSNAKTVGSGQPVTYQHKLTNTGNGPDSFDITVTPPAGWTVSMLPPNPIALAQGASTIVTVQLTPPPATPANTYPATVRATSRSSASAFQDVIDTTTIQAAAVPKITSVITPSSADQGATVTIAYTVANVGNADGTFNLSFTAPAGWNVTLAPPASVTVPFSGPPATFNVTLQVPANAIAGGYSVGLTATATSAPNAAATLTDQIAVKQQAALTLDPNFDDPTLRAPSTVVTYTNQLLTNNGNFTDTIHLAASTSRAGWSAQPVPATVTLNPGASTPIAVALTIPLGQLAGVQNTTTVIATSSLPAITDSSLITTTIASISGALFTPKSQVKVIDAGKPITFTYTLANSGSVTQTYTLAASGVPGGWTSTLTPASPTAALAPGATQAVTLVLQAPANTPDNTQASVTITAACVEKPCADATATAQLTIGPPFSVGVGGNCNGPALPGAVLTCVHTVTNTGFSADTYLNSTLSPLGWSTAVAPAVLFLAAGASGTVTITLAVPSSADAGLQHTLTFNARSTALPSVSQSLTDTTTVLQVADLSFSPDRITPTVGGQLVQFEHTLLNTGNGLDTYTITATQVLNWNITVVPTTTNALPRGTYQTIQVSIQVPPGATTVESNRITLRATSTFAPAIYKEVNDVVGTPEFVGKRWRFMYLPAQR
jgi:uncharacterized membrane protein